MIALDKLNVVDVGEYEVDSPLIKKYVADLKARGVKMPEDFSWAWMHKRTSLPKRLKAALYKIPEAVEGFNITDFVEQVSNELNDQRLAPATYRFKFQRGIDWKAGEYGDTNSCYWSDSKSASIPFLNHNDVLAVLFYDQEGSGIGRALGFEIGKDALLLFNSYGRLYDLDEIFPQRNSQSPGRQDAKLPRIGNLIAHFLGRQWKLVSLSAPKAQGLVDINNGRGVLIASPEMLRFATEVELDINASKIPRCPGCDRYLLDTDGLKKHDNRYICKRCAKNFFAQCVVCDKELAVQGGEGFENHGDWYCSVEHAESKNLHTSFGRGRLLLPREVLLPLIFRDGTKGYVYIPDVRVERFLACSKCGVLADREYRDVNGFRCFNCRNEAKELKQK